MAAPGERPHDLVVTNGRVAGEPPDVADAVGGAVRAGFGLVSLGLGVAQRTLGQDDGNQPARQGRHGPRLPVDDVADVLVGTAWGVARLSGAVATAGTRVAAPIVSLTFYPPGVPRRYQPAHGVAVLVNRWRRDRPDAVRSLGQWSSAALPGVVEATVDQVDVERLVTAVLDRIDLDRVVADVVRRLDVDALVAGVLARMDLAAAVSAVLDRLDLTQLVLERVDLARVIAEALERVDLTQIVMEQVDLVSVAEYVVEGIDLPEIIRDSTGSVASEAVRGLRMQGVDADLAVARVVDRMLFRRRNPRAAAAEVPAQQDRDTETVSERES